MEDGAAQQQAQLVENFCGVTSATRDVALFFLESHNWILDAAIATFYEHDEYDYRPLPVPSSGSQRRRTRSRGEEEENDNDEEYSPPQDSAPSPRRPANRSSAAVAAPNRRPPAPVLSRIGRKRPAPKLCGRRHNVRTFAGPSRSSGPGFDDDEEEDSDEPQESFTGGEESGMLLRDPSRRTIDVDSIFEQASLMEAMQRPVEPRPSSSRSFTGTVRLLSGETIQSTAPQQSEEVVHNIYFWSNGFTLNDGPLRRFDDPENVAFLESIKKSKCPKELAPADRTTAVSVNLIRREENCPVPVPVKQVSLFQGVESTVSSGSSNPSVMGTPVVSDNSPSVGLSVDSSKPSTSIQLRLADGTRMVARFNTHHTVGDVRAFIDASRPGASRCYRLRTVGFPHEQLDNLMQTIEEAGLANSVIIQHL